MEKSNKPHNYIEIKKGDVFDNWTVIEFSHCAYSNNQEFYKCQCACGNIKIIRKSQLVNGRTKSCGCNRGSWKITHNASRTKLYQIYLHMKDLCCNVNSSRFQSIPIDKFWAEDFLNFKKWADENEYKDGMYLVRKNFDDGYTPQNCYWDYNKNLAYCSVKYEYNGESLTLKELSDKYNINYSKLQNRLKNGLSIVDAIEFDDIKEKELYFGDKFGKLTVIGIAPIGREFGKNSYTCECSCGNICIRKFTDIVHYRNAACDKCLEHKQKI